MFYNFIRIFGAGEGGLLRIFHHNLILIFGARVGGVLFAVQVASAAADLAEGFCQDAKRPYNTVTICPSAGYLIILLCEKQCISRDDGSQLLGCENRERRYCDGPSTDHTGVVGE